MFAKKKKTQPNIVLTFSYISLILFLSVKRTSDCFVAWLFLRRNLIKILSKTQSQTYLEGSKQLPFLSHGQK